MNTEATNHYALTKKQLAILHTLYRFRFVTSDQLSAALNINNNTINKRLKLMTDLKYLCRKYEPIEGIPRKPAVYCLTQNGCDALKKAAKQKYLPKVLHNIRNDENASEQFVNHCLAVFDLYLAIRAKCGDELEFFTKTQMAAASYLPKQLSDAHIQIGSGEPRLFLLSLLHQDQPFFLATRTVFRYIDYAENGNWPGQHQFPKILLVCDTASFQKRLLKKMKRRIEDTNDPKLKFYITTPDQLVADEWCDMADPEEPQPLASI